MPLVLVLLAFLFRMSSLGLESLDIDEADGAAFIASGLPELLARLFQQGENGPFYYLLLHFWSLAAGVSEVALRFPSVMAGTLTVPLSYVWLRRLLGMRPALLGALTVTVSTYLIFYAQMVKMYALEVALVGLATYALVRAAESGRRRWWLLYIGAVSIALYVHIFAVLMAAWHGAYIVFQWRQQSRARRGWLAAVACLAVPYLPLGLWHLGAVRDISLLTRQFTGARTLPGMLAELAAEYGTLFIGAPRWAVSFFFLSLAALGLVWLLRHPRPRLRRAGLLLGCGVLAPVALVALLVLLGAPVYSPRYLIVTLLPFTGLWAAGMAAAFSQRPLLGLAGLGCLLALNGAHLAERDLGGMAFREDWRAAMSYVGLHALPGDGVVLLSSAAGNAYRYYGSPTAGMIDTEALRRQGGDSSLQAALDALEGQTRRLWLVNAYYELPDYPPVLAWLSGHSQYEREVWFRNVRVALHAPYPDPSFAIPDVSEPLRLTFGDELKLAGVDRERLPSRPGEPWQLRLVWQAMTAPATNYAVSLRVVDAEGTIWGRAEEPVGGPFQATSRWQAGQVAVQDLDVALTPGMPPGHYRLGLYVYRRDTVQNLAVRPSEEADSQFGLIGDLQLDAPLPADPSTLVAPESGVFANGLRLLGREALPAHVESRSVLPLTLVFAADRPLESEAVATIVLTDAAGHLIERRFPLSTPSLPLAAWPAGAAVARRISIPIPARFVGGTVSIHLKLVDDQDRPVPARTGVLTGASTAGLGSFSLDERFHTTVAPPNLVGQRVAFADGVALAGCFPIAGTLHPGDSLEVRPVWQADSEPQHPWTATIQLLNAAGQVIAQQDAPAGGATPSDGWQQGEVVEDRFNLKLPEGSAAGVYRLIVALYDPLSGRRLLTAEGRDFVELGAVAVGP